MEMCNHKLIAQSVPFEVYFNIKTKNGKVERASDVVVKELFDYLDLSEKNIRFLCTQCKEEFTMETIVDQFSIVCIHCKGIITKDRLCKFNEFYICEDCKRQYLKYCNICPHKESCPL